MSNPYAAEKPWSPEIEKTASVILHASSIIFELIAPIIGYLAFKDRGPFIKHHSKEQLNFAITVLLMYLILAISIIGLVVIWVVPIYSTIFRILAAIKASQGDFYKFPLTIRFIK